MLNRLIELSLKNRVLVVALACALGAWGWWAVGATPIDAIPDLSDNQVIVFTEWPGHGAQEVEDQVSYPLTVNLQGLTGVRVVRSQSAFGFSMIYVVFEDAIDQYFARARVLERLSLVSALLPEGTTPTLGPDATGVGHVFWYTVESDRHSLRDLRSIQDWYVRYQLNASPGWPKSPRSGATSSNTRSISIRTGSGPSTSRSARSWKPFAAAIRMSAATCSRRTARGRSSAGWG